MKNYLIGSKNRLDTATVSGGNWDGDHPLSRIQNRNLELAARSVDTMVASTIITADFGQSTYNRLWSLVDTNCTTEAQVRIIASQDPSFTTLEYDTGFVDFFDSIYASSELEFEDPNWFTGKPSEEDLEGWKRNFYYVSESNVTSRYTQIQISDPNNPDGYVRVPRGWVGPVWQFRYNPPFPGSIAFESNTLVDKSMDNVAFFDERAANRVLRFSLEHMDEAEAYSKALELVRKVDVHGEIIVIPDYENPKTKFRQSIYGRLRELSPLENFAYGMHRMGFEVEELI